MYMVLQGYTTSLWGEGGSGGMLPQGNGISGHLGQPFKVDFDTQ